MTIRLIKAVLTRDTELFGKMDPFCRFFHKNTTANSRVMEGAGKTPVFNQDFEFMIEGYDEEITLGAYDKESVKKDDFIGSTVLKADDLIALAKREDSLFDVEIHFKGKLGLTRSAGRIFLSAKYIDFNVQIEETKSEEIQFDAP